MLKRITQRYVNVKDDAAVREELGFMPTEEELLLADAAPAQHAKVRKPQE